MNKDKIIDRVMIVAVVIMIVLLTATTWADEVDVRQSNDMNTASGNVLGGDTTAIGFSSASFTAAISQCLASKGDSYLWGLWGNQRVTSNYHCMGLAYLQSGMLTAGEYILCTHTELSAMPDCEAAVAEFSRQIATEAVETADSDDFEAEYYAQAEMIEDQQMLIADLAAKYENLAQAEPQTIERTVIQQVPKLTEKQRAALAEVIAE